MYRRTTRVAARPVRLPAATAHWSAPVRVRALSATSMRTADCASAWEPAVVEAPCLPGTWAREPGGRAEQPHPATVAARRTERPCLPAVQPADPDRTGKRFH